VKCRSECIAFHTLEHHLETSDDFVEFVLAKFRVRFPEIRPSMNIVNPVQRKLCVLFISRNSTTAVTFRESRSPVAGRINCADLDFAA
jgi:hypothetical protein